MKTKNSLKRKRRIRKNKKEERHLYVSAVVMVVCAVLLGSIAVDSGFFGNGERGKIYAASEEEADYTLPTGIAGMVTSVINTAVPEKIVKRIGTSCEQVMVGQRVSKVANSVADLNVSESMASRINDMDSTVMSLSATPKIMSDTDYQTLLRIVEAEAGTEDLKGRIMIANVVMNRVKSDAFPNSVVDVVWEYTGGVAQFSPVYDGRIGEVTISDETREAVKQALEGVDYSEGALFFVQKSAADVHSVSWFEKDLTRLFKHGVHEFYTYPELAKKTGKEEDKKESSDEDLVQLVKSE